MSRTTFAFVDPATTLEGVGAGGTERIGLFKNGVSVRVLLDQVDASGHTLDTLPHEQIGRGELQYHCPKCGVELQVDVYLFGGSWAWPPKKEKAQ